MYTGFNYEIHILSALTHVKEWKNYTYVSINQTFPALEIENKLLRLYHILLLNLLGKYLSSKILVRN